MYLSRGLSMGGGLYLADPAPAFEFEFENHPRLDASNK